MDSREFQALAERLTRGATEGEWRSAVSRAYYAGFHLARLLLAQCGFLVPRADRAHSYLWLRLANSGHPDVQKAGGSLDSVRRSRNHADYDLNLSFRQATAVTHVQAVAKAIRTLEAAFQEPVKTQITDAMKVYERDVLCDVTWHP